VVSIPNIPGGTPDGFYLTIDDKKFEGWLEVRVEKSLDQFAHSFSLTYFDKWSIDDEPWEIWPDDECNLYWASTSIIIGHITRTELDITGDSYSLTATGRSATADLVDCSALHNWRGHTTGQWRQVTLKDIVTDLCGPFDIEVKDYLRSDRKFKRFEIDEGETVHDAINRACQIRGALPITTGDGAVAIVRTELIGLGTTELDLDMVIRRSAWHDSQDRYSEYHFKGQSSATDEDYGDNVSLQKGFATDPSILRYRPLVVMGDGSHSKEDLGERALWERNIRAARSDQITYEVDGVTNSDGNVWEPGMFVRVDDDLLRVHDTFLLNSVSMVLDGTSGLRTTLTLISPETLDMVELPERGNAYNA